MTDMKQCAKCKELKDRNDFHDSYKLRGDGKASYCKECCVEASLESKIRKGEKDYHRDGFRTEEDHFNYALRHYAKLFDCPSLLKHQTNTGSIKRYYRDDLEHKYKYND